MRNLLALLAAVVLLFLGVGAWRGWYGISKTTAETGKIAFRFEIDAIRVGADAVEVVRYLSRKSEEEKNPTP